MYQKENKKKRERFFLVDSSPLESSHLDRCSPFFESSLGLFWPPIFALSRNHRVEENMRELHGQITRVTEHCGWCIVAHHASRTMHAVRVMQTSAGCLVPKKKKKEKK